MDKEVVERLGLLLEELENSIRVFNINGMKNTTRDVPHTVKITIKYHRHREELWAEVTSLGKNSLILGYTWLKKHNPVKD